VGRTSRTTPKFVRPEWEKMSNDELRAKLDRLKIWVRDNRHFLYDSQYTQDKNPEFYKNIARQEREARELACYYRQRNQLTLEFLADMKMKEENYD